MLSCYLSSWTLYLPRCMRFMLGDTEFETWPRNFWLYGTYSWPRTSTYQRGLLPKYTIHGSFVFPREKTSSMNMENGHFPDIQGLIFQVLVLHWTSRVGSLTPRKPPKTSHWVIMENKLHRGGKTSATVFGEIPKFHQFLNASFTPLHSVMHS